MDWVRFSHHRRLGAWFSFLVGGLGAFSSFLMASTSTPGRWLICGWLLCSSLLSLSCKGKVWRDSKKRCLSPCSHSHHGHSAYSVLWPLAEAHRRPRHRDYLQRCRICPSRSRPNPSNPIRSKASTFPAPDLVTKGNGQDTGTSTIRILGLQKFPPYCITITRETSVASRTGLTSRIAISFSG